MPAKITSSARRIDRAVRHFAVYGKGGSGKSTVAANLSIHLARRGLKTLQIGCDPKRDSTRALVGGRRLRTVMDVARDARQIGSGKLSSSDFMFPGPEGICCLEAGGPEAGVGCAGLGITTTFRLIQEFDILRQFDVVLMDVLGDIVCGGFAAPMMRGLAGGVIIVASETPLSLYAANNIARAVKRYSRHGTYLIGVLANAVQKADGVKVVERFASAIGSSVIGAVPHDERFRQAERKAQPVSVFAPGSDLDRIFEKLAATLVASSAGKCQVPRPLEDEQFEKLFWGDEA